MLRDLSRQMQRLASIFVVGLAIFNSSCGLAAGVEVVPFNYPGDGAFQSVVIGGKSYYQNLADPNRYIYFDVPASFTVTGQPIYVQVFYLEYGNGFLGINYDSNHVEGTLLAQKYWGSEESYGTVCTNGRVAREAVFKLELPRFEGRQNGNADFRLAGFFGTERMTIEKVLLWTTPPPYFVEKSIKPWLQPYSGPERSDINATTLDGKVLCGYQGWFNTPRDGAEVGYRHWTRDPFAVTSTSLTVDYWPAVSEYDPADLFRVIGMTHPGSLPAYLYSAFNSGPVLRHFRWMREYGIDGVFLSRFVTSTQDPKSLRIVNMVLNNVREGCHREGRTWAMMYDMSGTTTETGGVAVMNDWKFLCDQVHIREDSRFLHHNGKPVVMLWGFGFNDRPWTAQQAQAVINFFKSDATYGGNYVIGGVDPGWRTLSAGSSTDPAWTAVYQSFDSISPWDVGRYYDLTSLQNHKTNYWAPDLADVNSRGQGYAPVVFPGFSWDNLFNYAPGTSNIPRLGGDFLWKQIYHLKSLGAKTLFVAMFDEVDEGTAIYKVSNSPPVEAFFRTYEDKSEDWYLKLAGAGSMMWRDQSPLSETIPANIPFPVVETAAGASWELYP
ncbi:MAG: glycoside hydrolase family 71/99-like protein [Candidatus Sumerlaeaceae bacterium]